MASAGTIRAGKAAVEAGLDDSALVAGLRAVEGKIRAASARIQGIGTSMLKAGAAMAAPLVLASKGFISAGSALNDMAARTGASVEALSAWIYAAQQTGASGEQVEAAVRKMQRTLTEAAQGSKTAGDALVGLGLSADKLAAASPEEQFATIAKAVAAVPDPTRKAALAMEVFGKSGTALLPMAADFDRLTGEAKKFGAVWSTEAATAADEAGDALDSLYASAKSAAMAVGQALAPAIKAVSEDLITVAGDAAAWIRENQQAVVSYAKATAGVIAAGAAFNTLGNVLRVAAAGMAAIRASMAATAATARGLAAALTFLGKHPALLLFTAGATLGGAAALTEEMGRLRVQQIEEQGRADKAAWEARKRAAAEAKKAPAAAASAISPEQTAQTKQAADFERQMAERLQDIKLAMIDDEHRRRLAQINLRYDRELQRAKELGASTIRVEEARWAEMAAAAAEVQRERQREAQREAQRAAKELADYERDLNDLIAKEMIEANFTGREKQLALLGLEESEALRRAREVGGSEAKVRELFALRAAAIERAAVPDTKWTTAGTFSGRGASGLAAGGPAERTAAATEASLQELRRLRQAAKPLVFSA